MTPAGSNEGLVVALLTADATGARISAATGLAEARSDAGMAALRQGLRDPAERVRQACAVALIRLDDRAVLDWVVRGLKSPSEDVAVGAALVLGQAGNKLAVPFLLEAFRTKSAHVAHAVAEALGLLGDNLAAPLLCLALEHRFVPLSAALALGRLGDLRAVPTLLRVLDRSKDAELRASAVRALGAIKQRRRVRHLRPADAASDVRVMPSLRKALRDSSARVRVTAALALWQLGERTHSRQAMRELATAVG